MKENERIIPSESDEQKTVVEWCEVMSTTYPCLHLIFHIPNGSYKSPAMASKFKREGLKKGVPDLFLPVPKKDSHGLWIEMKKRKGGTVSDEQKFWINELRIQGYTAEVCHGADEAIELLLQYISKE